MAENEPRQDPRLEEDTRLASLDERLRQARLDEAERTAKPRPDANYRLGLRVLGELIGAPAGGAVVGWVLDQVFGTFPWLLLAMLFLGFGVGFRNIVRMSRPSPGSNQQGQ